MPRKIIVSANETAFHRMIRRELRNTRRIVSNYELFSSSLVGLSAKVIADHGGRYG